MKNFIKSIRLTLVFCLSVFYILILWIFAQFAGPNSGNAEVATLDGKIVGAANVGQVFTEDIYFWGRPSCAGDGYDASSSAGSNKGPTNEEYLAEVETRPCHHARKCIRTSKACCRSQKYGRNYRKRNSRPNNLKTIFRIIRNRDSKRIKIEH